jgi:hypothetical protein
MNGTTLRAPAAAKELATTSAGGAPKNWAPPSFFPSRSILTG